MESTPYFIETSCGIGQSLGITIIWVSPPSGKRRSYTPTCSDSAFNPSVQKPRYRNGTPRSLTASKLFTVLRLGYRRGHIPSPHALICVCNKRFLSVLISPESTSPHHECHRRQSMLAPKLVTSAPRLRWAKEGIGFTFGYTSDNIIYMATQEIYPNAPIVLMIAEIRHTPCNPLSNRWIRSISDALKEKLPLNEAAQEVSFSISGDAEGPKMQQPQTTNLHTWYSRDRMILLELRPNMISLKTTRYQGYVDFRNLLQTVLKAVKDTENPDGFIRIGLRYIDEIRAPFDDPSQLDWSQWVSSSLTGPKGVDLPMISQEGTALFTSGREDATILALRYGSQYGYAVESTPQLRRPMPTPGPFFRFDIDSFLDENEVPEFDVNAILGICDRLHTPVRDVFESLITDKLRNEVLRNDK